MSGKAIKETPLMGQYNKIKAKYPDAILLFRVGDFYETFNEDAIVTARTLGIVLTKRANGAASEMELAGFPYHALDTYLPKLVKAGYRVAICEQLEDPKLTKTIVKRGVTEIVTPGIAINEKLLDHKSNNYLAAVHYDKQFHGLALTDVSTGEFYAMQGSPDYIDRLLQSFRPSEILVSKAQKKQFVQQYRNEFYTFPLDEWIFQHHFGYEKLTRHFDTLNLKGFGLEELPVAVIAAGAVMHYLQETQHPNLSHIHSISRIQHEGHLWLDKFTIRNLELIHNPHGGKSLADIIDHTLTPMGARLLRKWILFPLVDIRQIQERHQVVEYFVKEPETTARLRGLLRQLGDIERLMSRVPLGKASPRDVGHLGKSLKIFRELKKECSQSDFAPLQAMGDQFNPCDLLFERINHTLVDDLPTQLHKGEVIREGVSKELDEVRHIKANSQKVLTEIQEKEALRTGISSLKISFNNVFGYYLEVRNTHKERVPIDWIRKQTLSNAERYITPELKTLEEKILGAEEKITTLEGHLFEELIRYCQEYIKPIQLNASLTARVDCLLGFAEAAVRHQYRKPIVNEGLAIHIQEGRHPVIERQLAAGEQYVPNDIFLDTEKQQIIILTGPNMSGKSAVLRQTALICLLAQTGSFVPASKAELGVLDRIFTRVGAADNLASGESTFMVEMIETASILNNLSSRSLILLDEIGRGTSTYDGISIAWSIAEYLHNQPQARAKTLFATHYHEMSELAERFHRIRNFHVSTREVGNKVIFLRTLTEGESRHSFGIHVARMAGIPKQVTERADELLEEMEQKSIAGEMRSKVKKLSAPSYQLSFFGQADEVAVRLKQTLQAIDINTLTPVEALMKLQELKRELE